MHCLLCFYLGIWGQKNAPTLYVAWVWMNFVDHNGDFSCVTQHTGVNRVIFHLFRKGELTPYTLPVPSALLWVVQLHCLSSSAVSKKNCWEASDQCWLVGAGTWPHWPIRTVFICPGVPRKEEEEQCSFPNDRTAAMGCGIVKLHHPWRQVQRGWEV